jgi:ORF 111
MQIAAVQPEKLNNSASAVATKARDINSTLKKAADKIKATILATENAAQKLKDVQDAIAEFHESLKSKQQINTNTEPFTRELDFSVNKEINRVIVRVIDKQTSEIIKEIPSREMQNIQLRIQELLGQVFDKQV